MTDRADRLRAEFDGAFAAPIAATDQTSVDLLLVRAGDVAFAILRADITGLHADVAIIPVPTRAAELLGLAAIRNVVVPVYAIDRIIGSARSTTPRWLVTTPTCALAFEAFDGYRRVANLPAVETKGHLRGVVDTGGEIRPILDIDSVVATISRKER